MSTQTLLRISFPEGVTLYASHFREMLAKLPEVPAALFHRDVEGKTLNERPGIRVVGGTGWVGLLADSEREPLVTAVAGAAILAVSAYAKRPCKVQMESLQFGVKLSHAPQAYWVREMAIKRKSPKARAQEVGALIAERVLTSIEATCEKYGFDCPTADQLEISTAEIIRERGMNLETSTGLTGMFVHLVDALVIVHADLDGMWFVGNLTARGYGRLIRPRPGMRMEENKRGGVLK